MTSVSPKLKELLSKGRQKYANRGMNAMVKVKEGKTTVRVLPAIGEDGKFWADLGLHWIKADIKSKPVAVVGCAEKVHDQPCVVCNAIVKSLSECVDSQSEELIKSWRSKKTAILNVIIRDGADKSESVQMLEVTATVMDNILNLVDIHADEGIFALDAATGIDFVIERRGKMLDTEYTVAAKPGTSPPVTKAQMEGRHDLMSVIEKEFFRGDETKALNQIAQITGVSMPIVSSALTSGRATNAALTSSVAAGADDFTAEAAKAPKVDPNSTAVHAAVAGSKPVIPITVPATQAESGITENVTIADDEMNALLAELDTMTAP